MTMQHVLQRYTFSYVFKIVIVTHIWLILFKCTYSFNRSLVVDMVPIPYDEKTSSFQKTKDVRILFSFLDTSQEPVPLNTSGHQDIDFCFSSVFKDVTNQYIYLWLSMQCLFYRETLLVTLKC